MRLGETHRADVDRDETAKVWSPTMNSVEPPPMSITQNGSSLAGSHDVAPRKARRPSSDRR